VIALKCALLVSQSSYGHFLKLIQFYVNNTTNLRHLTRRIMSCYMHKMAIVSRTRPDPTRSVGNGSGRVEYTCGTGLPATPAPSDTCEVAYTHGDSDVISFLIYASWFRRHFVGKILINVAYCDTA